MAVPNVSTGHTESRTRPGAICVIEWHRRHLWIHRARYYSQSLRRFIQEDPVEGSTSPYAYVHGSPLEATDPSGMMDPYES